MRNYIEIGKIVNTHGILGVVKVEPWCDSPSVLAGMKRVFLAPKVSGDNYKELKVMKASVQKDHVLMTLDTVDSIEKAASLKTVVIFAAREDIPLKDGAHLIDDLKGLPVIDINSGKKYGILHDVIQGAASDIYEIKTENGDVLIPAVKEFVKEIDLDKGIFIAPIGGMFDEN